MLFFLKYFSFSKYIWLVNTNYLISTLSAGVFVNEISNSLESIKLFSISDNDFSILI
jgi:hypothetical protein